MRSRYDTCRCDEPKSVLLTSARSVPSVKCDKCGRCAHRRNMEQVEAEMVAHAESVCGPNPFEHVGGGWLFGSMKSDLHAWLKRGPANASGVDNKGNAVVIGCPGDFTLMHRCVRVCSCRCPMHRRSASAQDAMFSAPGSC